MLYEAYQTHTDLLYPLRATAGSALTLLEHPGQVLRSARLAYPGSDANARAAAAFELIARAQLTHTRPAFDIDTVVVGGREVAVTEEVIVATPFAQLLRFARDQPGEQPRVLLVAPMSGHFATLLAGHRAHPAGGSRRLCDRLGQCARRVAPGTAASASTNTLRTWSTFSKRSGRART